MRRSDVDDVYELSPLQQGILFHSLYQGDGDVYLNQRSFLVTGPLDVGALVTACHASVRSHTSLRTSFHWEGLDKPLQVVHRDAPPVVTEHDWTGHELDDDLGRDPRLRAFLADDLATPVRWRRRIPIAPPTLASLFVVVGGLSRRPRVVDDEIVVRDVLNLTVTIDHNVVDGAPATRFGADLRHRMENPSTGRGMWNDG